LVSESLIERPLNRVARIFCVFQAEEEDGKNVEVAEEERGIVEEEEEAKGKMWRREILFGRWRRQNKIVRERNIVQKSALRDCSFV